MPRFSLFSFCFWKSIWSKIQAHALPSALCILQGVFGWDRRGQDRRDKRERACAVSLALTACACFSCEYSSASASALFALACPSAFTLAMSACMQRCTCHISLLLVVQISRRSTAAETDLHEKSACSCNATSLYNRMNFHLPNTQS